MLHSIETLNALLQKEMVLKSGLFVRITKLLSDARLGEIAAILAEHLDFKILLDK